MLIKEKHNKDLLFDFRFKFACLKVVFITFNQKTFFN